MHTQHYNLAFVFPGQGSQSLGMLSQLATAFPVVGHTFQEASDALGFDLWQLVANGPEADLNQTHNTQPAMLAAGVAVWRVWCQQSPVRPAWMAGHSLGEYTAMVCAEAMPFVQAVKLVAARGRLMQQAVPAGAGAMAAILGLDDHLIVNTCADVAHGQVVTAANFNSPGQVVIAGDTAAVERAMEALKALGAKRALKLPVSVPSHCALMAAAAEAFAELLAGVTITTPQCTLIHNADVASHAAPDAIRNALKEQLYQSVRWVETIALMHAQGVGRFVECGPGKVLMGLNKRIAGDALHVSIFDIDSLSQAEEAVGG